MTEATTSSGGSRDRVALSRELGEFLIELAIALQKHGMYPEGHPLLEAVADNVVERLHVLLRERSALSLGVAREQLVIEGTATDTDHPVLRQLARRLHSHYLGAVKFRPGVTPAELASVLRVLAGDPRQHDGQPLGLRPESERGAWPHVGLFPMSLDQLELVETDERDHTRAARLWVELARAAVAAEDDAAVPTDPDVVASAIDERPASSAYDQVIVGYLLEIARELRSGDGEAQGALKRRFHSLVDRLSPPTLQRLVEMGGDRAQQRRFMLDANASMSCDAVVRLLEATADAAARPISESLLRILSKLAQHAGHEDAAGRDDADQELRSVVSRMLEGWELDDPNPAGYGFALAGLAGTREEGTVTGQADATPEAVRILQMCLESDAVGPALDRAVDRLIEERGVQHVLDALDDAADTEAAEAVWDLLAQPARFAVVIRQPDLRSGRIEPILARLGSDAAPLLLDAMSESEDRSSRRAAFDLLVHLGPPILPIVDERLDDDRWFVLRNLLAIHNALGTAPEGPVESRLLSHPDPRVRREAVKIGLRAPGHRDTVLRMALGDTDERVLQLGLLAARRGTPANAVPLVLARATDEALPEALRSSAVKALGQLDQPEALRTLLELAGEGRGLLGSVRLAGKTPVTVAAIGALAEGWSHHPEAQAVLDRARSSRDVAFREAAGTTR